MMFLVLRLALVVGLTQAFPNVAVPQKVMNELYKAENNQHDIVNRVQRSLSTSFTQHSTYIGEANSLTCYVCWPGFYRTGDCQTNLTVGQCAKCPSNTYNSNFNVAMRCAECTKQCLDPNALVDRPCSATADMECRCKDGYYNHSKGSGEWMCIPHSKCGPGKEPLQNGTSVDDTICQKCTSEWYSSSKSSIDKCKRCSTCGSGFVERERCDGVKDTVCISKGQALFLKVGVPIIVVVLIVMIVVTMILVYCKKSGYMPKMYKKFRSCRHKSKNEETPIAAEEKSGNTQKCYPQISGDRTQLECIPQAKTSGDVQENEWTQVFLKIVSYIDKNEDVWKSVIRTLLSRHYNTSEIENRLTVVSNDYHGLNEIIYQSLLIWKKRAGDEAYLDEIVDALSTCDMTGPANILKNKFSSYMRPISESSINTIV